MLPAAAAGVWSPALPGRTLRGRAVAAVGALLLALAGGALAGCYGLRPTPEPIPTLGLQDGPDGSRCLVLLLPGRGDGPRDFLANRFASVGAANGLAADVVAVDSHMGYFRDHSVVERLHHDVVAPAVADGAGPVWLAGISLGGMASLLYLR